MQTFLPYESFQASASSLDRQRLRAICEEWTSRGYKDTCLQKTEDMTPKSVSDYPEWLGREDLHRSHRMNLMRKDPTFYVFPDAGDPVTAEYVWPV